MNIYRSFLIFLMLLSSSFGRCTEVETLENLILEQAESIAMTHNYTILSLYHRLNQRYYQYQEKKGECLPQATLSVQPQIEENRFKSPVDLSVKQILYDVETGYHIKESRIDYAITKLELYKEIVDVLFQVRQAYFEVILGQHQQVVEESIVTHIQEDLDRHEKQVKLGALSSLEINQIKLQLNKALVEYYDSQRRVKVGLYQLLNLLGFPPQTPIQLASQEIPLPPFEELNRFTQLTQCSVQMLSTQTLQQWENLAMSYRPELKQEQANVIKAQVEIGRYQHPYRPTVSAFANVGHACTFKNFSQRHHWNAGIAVEWTLLDGYKRQNRLKQAKAASAEATSIEVQTQLETKNEVHRLLAEMEKEFQSYLVAKESERLGQEAITMATRKQQLGSLPYMEYLESIKSWRETRRDVNQAKFDLLNAYFNLVKFSGADLIYSSLAE
jgi:outer membrane protein TolC